MVDGLKAWSGEREVRPSPRVIVQQSRLPKYRVPFFKELMCHDGIDLMLRVSSNDNFLANAESSELNVEFAPMWTQQLGRRGVMWHSAQWNSAKRDACDVLILSWNVHSVSLIPALLRARFNGIKTILWGHGYSKKESFVRKRIRDSVGRLADALLFYDYMTAEKFIEAGWDERKIHTAPNSLDQASIQRARALWVDDSQRMEEFQRDKGLVRRDAIIYIGRIYEENRLDLLIKALPVLKKKYPEVCVLVIGERNACADDLVSLAEDLGVDDSIMWLDEVYEEELIAPYMLSSKLFCYPANIGLSIMHAMGYGLPVLTGDHGKSHNPEIHALKNGINGCLFKHLDADDLATKVSELLDRPKDILSYGSAGRASVMEFFTTEKMADGFMAAIRSVLSEGDG